MPLSALWSESNRPLGSGQGFKIALVAMAIGATASGSVVSSLVDVARTADEPIGRAIVLQAIVRNERVLESRPAQRVEPPTASVPPSTAVARPANDIAATPTGPSEPVAKSETRSEHTQKTDRRGRRSQRSYWPRSANIRWLDRGSIWSVH